jgi:hypothetical protein
MTDNVMITVEGTGEILEFPASTPEEMLQTWLMASNYIKAYERVKDRIKRVIPEFTDARGILELPGYIFRVSDIQRYTYDKAVLRQVFDEDTFDLFMEPSKKAVDEYLKEHLAEMGEDSTTIRKAMVPVGKAYQTIRVEKV